MVFLWEYPLQILTELVLYTEQVTTNGSTSDVLSLHADDRVPPKHGNKQVMLCMLCAYVGFINEKFTSGPYRLIP
jgi:hypothetical protein